MHHGIEMKQGRTTIDQTMWSMIEVSQHDVILIWKQCKCDAQSASEIGDREDVPLIKNNNSTEITACQRLVMSTTQQ